MKYLAFFLRRKKKKKKKQTCCFSQKKKKKADLLVPIQRVNKVIHKGHLCKTSEILLYADYVPFI